MEMKNICGKIPVELHEKLKLEVEELGISIPKHSSAKHGRSQPAAGT